MGLQLVLGPLKVSPQPPPPPPLTTFSNDVIAGAPVLGAAYTCLGTFSLDRPEYDSLQGNLGVLSFLHPIPSASLKHSLFSRLCMYTGAFFSKFHLLIFGCAGSLLGFLRLSW